MAPQQFWLMKSEPDVYSIDHLKKDGKGHWDGVRNYQARNFMRDKMKKGDLVLFYHSNADPPGIAGIAKVSREGYPDFTSWDPKSDYYDPRSTKEKPAWFMVDLEFVEKFSHFIPLPDLRAKKELKGMLVIRPGMRLSVQPVDARHFKMVEKMGRAHE